MVWNFRTKLIVSEMNFFIVFFFIFLHKKETVSLENKPEV